ncbi:hypothetical protein BOTBODRAFT_243384 [Botryobasidium botryosum FD-172 SS1]|uniref:Uncharacterized protein n=1 Tax=Botryobasidium botryosum (strain FD-172 SS1) TaxID=930990 RepID=A0A067M578_BOTB1|nr:hypothetical protein BOTBODRAFT_243384 [Botryobasidium botryosum FD-172 SS1]
MYTHESRQIGPEVAAKLGETADQGLPSPSSDGGGPGIELLELSNGEVVWQVIDGLRSNTAFGDYEDDHFQHRASIASEYSGRDARDDPVKLLFKEHKRMSSKGSVASSRKKLFTPNARPETKVFFSTAAQIERFIESISQGLDSASFNIVPDTRVPILPLSNPAPSGHKSVRSQSES